jgi:hypothetical protein
VGGSAIFLFCLAPSISLHSQSSSAEQSGFDSRDLSGVWWVKDPDPQRILDRGKFGDASKCQTCHFSLHDNIPEPPLTDWGSKHLTIPNEIPGPGPAMTMVPARATNCDPIGLPAQFWYTQFAPFEIVNAPGRIFQLFENHREWRFIWVGREHPKRLNSSYLGDSVAKWEKDVLVVDTIGFNGKNLIEPVAVNHLMSDSFHLEEHWTRVSKDTLELKITYYDPKAWGQKPWAGFHMEFVRQRGMQLAEGYCSIEENKKFEQMVTEPATRLPK